MATSKIFNEGTQVTAVATFRAGGAVFPPQTVHYHLRNATVDKVMRDWTSVTAADRVSISIPAGLVTIEDDSNRKELQELTVVADRGLDTQVTEVISWYVKNLKVV